MKKGICLYIIAGLYISIFLAGVVVLILNREWIIVHATLAVGIITIYVMLGGWLWAFNAVREAARDRHWNALMYMGERWESPDLQWARRLAHKLGSDGIKQTLLPKGETARRGYFELVALGSFFEELGIGWKENHFPLKLINERLGPSVERYYKLYEEYVKKMQEKDPTARIYCHFRDLAEAIEKINKNVKREAEA